MNKTHRGLISRMADKLQAWLDSEDCECPPEGCFCGRQELEALIAEARAVSAVLSPGERLYGEEYGSIREPWKYPDMVSTVVMLDKERK